jgi:hypothetical protein
MTDTPRQKRQRADALLAKLQECESKALALGLAFQRTAHAINKAKNAVGLDLANAAEKEIDHD